MGVGETRSGRHGRALAPCFSSATLAARTLGSRCSTRTARSRERRSTRAPSTRRSRPSSSSSSVRSQRRARPQRRRCGRPRSGSPGRWSRGAWPRRTYALDDRRAGPFTEARHQEGHAHQRPRGAVAGRAPRAPFEAAPPERRGVAEEERIEHRRHRRGHRPRRSHAHLGRREVRPERDGGRPRRLRRARRHRSRAPPVFARALRAGELGARPLRQRPRQPVRFFLSGPGSGRDASERRGDCLRAGSQCGHRRRSAWPKKAKPRRALSSSSRRSTAPRPGTWR